MSASPLSCRFRLYRHVTFSLEFTFADRRAKLLFDPLLAAPGEASIPGFPRFPRTPLPVPPEEVMAAELTLVTHGHEDHLDRLARAALGPGSIVVCPPGVAKKLARQSPAIQVIPLSPGHRWTYDERIQIQAVVTAPVPRLAGLFNAVDGGGIGFMLTAGEKRIYISGDTVLSPAVSQALGDGPPIDAAILYGGQARIPLFGAHTLSTAEIRQFCQTLAPRQVIVIHLDELKHCAESRQDVRRATEGLPEVFIPDNGETLQLTPEDTDL